MFFGPGMMEIAMIMVMSGMSWGSSAVSIMGLPPAEMDTVLVRTAPADSVLYVEWAERGPGKEGGKGIEGLAADPEVKQFIKDVWKAIETGIAKQTERGPEEEKVLGKSLPPLIRILLDRPGCVSVAIDDKALKAGAKAGADAPPHLKWIGMVGAVRVAVVFNGGKQADDIAKHISELVQLLPADKRTKDLNRQPIPLPDAPPGISLTLHRHKNYFILGFGADTIDNAIAGIDGKAKGLGGSEGFANSLKSIKFDRTANYVWIDVKGAIGKVEGVLGEQVTAMVKMLGLDTVDVIATATGVVDGQMLTRNYVGTGGKTEGVLALFSGRGIKPADLKHVPADSDLVLAFSVNAKNVLGAVKKIVAAADPKSAANLNEIIKQFETELGLRLEADIFAALGDVWVLHDSKSAGGVYLTSLVASAEVRDAKKAREVYTKLMDVLESTLPGGVRGEGFGRKRGVFLKNKKYLGETIHYINFVGEPIPVAPAFCLTKTHLLIAPHPQALKAHLRFLASGDKNFASRLDTEFALPKGDMLGFTYCESKPLVRALYGIAPYVGSVISAMVQSEGAEIDIFSLPSARAILPYVGNTYSTTVRTDKGILSEGRTSIPVPVATASLVIMPIMFLGMSVREEFGPRAIEKKAFKVMRAEPNPEVEKTLRSIRRLIRETKARQAATAG